MSIYWDRFDFITTFYWPHSDHVGLFEDRCRECWMRSNGLLLNSSAANAALPVQRVFRGRIQVASEYLKGNSTLEGLTKGLFFIGSEIISEALIYWDDFIHNYVFDVPKLNEFFFGFMESFSHCKSIAFEIWNHKWINLDFDFHTNYRHTFQSVESVSYEIWLWIAMNENTDDIRSSYLLLKIEWKISTSRKKTSDEKEIEFALQSKWLIFALQRKRLIFAWKIHSNSFCLNI